MRYAAAEKLEIIRLVEQSSLSVCALGVNCSKGPSMKRLEEGGPGEGLPRFPNSRQRAMME